MKPIERADGTFAWYRNDHNENVTHDGTFRLADHWLPPAVFDRLTGGTLLPLMGIRIYPSREEAEEALAGLK